MIPNRSNAARCIALIALTLTSAGCGTTYSRRNPVGEMFPTVQGRNLSDQPRQLPGDWAGEPVVVFVGYEQNTQFDIDRWLLGMQQARINVRAYEVPTIPGLVPGLFAGTIDEGMR